MENEFFNMGELPVLEELEPTIDNELSPMMEPPSALTCRIPVTPPRQYWQAQGIATSLHRQFEALKKDGDIKGMRRWCTPAIPGKHRPCNCSRTWRPGWRVLTIAWWRGG